MQLIVVLVPALLVGCLLLYWVGRRVPHSLPFLVARLAVFLGVWIAWCWMLVDLGGHFETTVWRLLALVPATAGLLGLAGLDLLRHRAAQRSS